MPYMHTVCDECRTLDDCVRITVIPGGRQPDRRAVTIVLCKTCYVRAAVPDVDPAFPAHRRCERCGTLATCAPRPHPETTTAGLATLTIARTIYLCTICAPSG